MSGKKVGENRGGDANAKYCPTEKTEHLNTELKNTFNVGGIGWTSYGELELAALRAVRESLHEMNPVGYKSGTRSHKDSPLKHLKRHNSSKAVGLIRHVDVDEVVVQGVKRLENGNRKSRNDDPK